MSAHFDPSKVQPYYGADGQRDAKKMSDALHHHDLDVAFDPSTKTFTVLNSKNMEKTDIDRIFKEKQYESWEPRVMNQKDALGNRMVELLRKKDDVKLYVTLTSIEKISPDHGHSPIPETDCSMVPRQVQMIIQYQRYHLER